MPVLNSYVDLSKLHNLAAVTAQRESIPGIVIGNYTAMIFYIILYPKTGMIIGYEEFLICGTLLSQGKLFVQKRHNRNTTKMVTCIYRERDTRWYSSGKIQDYLTRMKCYKPSSITEREKLYGWLGRSSKFGEVPLLLWNKAPTAQTLVEIHDKHQITKTIQSYSMRIEHQ